MTMITPSYLGETIEYSSLHACRSTLEDPTWRRQPAGVRHTPVCERAIKVENARIKVLFLSDKALAAATTVSRLVGIGLRAASKVFSFREVGPRAACEVAHGAFKVVGSARTDAERAHVVSGAPSKFRLTLHQVVEPLEQPRFTPTIVVALENTVENIVTTPSRAPAGRSPARQLCCGRCRPAAVQPIVRDQGREHGMLGLARCGT